MSERKFFETPQEKVKKVTQKAVLGAMLGAAALGVGACKEEPAKKADEIALGKGRGTTEQVVEKKSFEQKINDLKDKYAETKAHLEADPKYLKGISQGELQNIADYNVYKTISGNKKLNGLTQEKVNEFEGKYGEWLPRSYVDIYLGTNQKGILLYRSLNENGYSSYDVFWFEEGGPVGFYERYTATGEAGMISFNKFEGKIKENIRKIMEDVKQKEQRAKEREQKFKVVRDSIEKEIK